MAIYYPTILKVTRENLFKKGASVIFILTDLDQDQCITKTRLRIIESENQIIIVAVKQIESWFLSDNFAMNQIFQGDYSFEYPENEDIPFETIRNTYLEKFNRGLVGRNEKKRLAQKMINSGFSIENAANHPNCPSANYFLTKLKQCASIKAISKNRKMKKYTFTEKKDTRSGFGLVCRCWDKPTQM
jgi:hypothetical protein